MLWPTNVFYQVAAVAQLAFYLCAILGAVASQARLPRIKVLTLPMFFCLVNAAALMATWKLLRGERVVLWQPQRAAPRPAPSPVSAARQYEEQRVYAN
jgi:hypothetical protein